MNTTDGWALQSVISMQTGLNSLTIADFFIDAKSNYVETGKWLIKPVF